VKRIGHALREQLARLLGSFGRRRFEKEFDEEIEAHLALLTDLFVSRGLSPQQARYAARKQFGGVTQMKNELRDRGRFRPLEAFLQDSNYVVRQFRRSPLFAITSILTLALGIGANTAMFTLVDQLILRLLPVEDPQQIVALVAQGPYYGDNMGRNVLSYTMYQTIRDRNQVFSRMMCHRPVEFTVTSSESEVLSGELVSGNYFPTLGIKAAAGRLFTSNDDLHPRAHPVAVLSYDCWKTKFSEDSRIIGRTILLNNYPLTIIGVSAPGFNGLEPGLPTQLFAPMMMTPALFPQNDYGNNMFDPRLRWVNVYGRLSSGITQERAKAALQPLFHQILQAEVLQPGFAHAAAYDREQFLKMWMDVVPGGQGNTVMRRQYEKPLLLVMGVTGFVLLIACANLASLLAARSVVRQKEIAVRLAIGSSRARIVQQLMTESLLLALAGGTCGIGLAIVIVKALLAFLPQNPTGYAISNLPDLRVLCFTVGLSLTTGLVFGLIPALQAVRQAISNTLKCTAGNVSGGAGYVTFRKSLVSIQIALSLLLLIGAGLFIRSLSNLHSVDPGFQTGNLAQFDMDLGSIGYDSAHAHTFYDELEARLEQLPGVTSAGIATNAVLADSNWESHIRVAGRVNKPGEKSEAYVNRVSPGYFKTLGIHLLAGRTFRPTDVSGAPNVVVVSQTFARRFFGSEPATGRRVGRGLDITEPTDLEIVGVVNDIDYQDLRERDSAQLYLCAPQGLELYTTVYLSTHGSSGAVLSSARGLVHRMEPKAPVMNMKTVDEQLEESLVTERMVASISTGFTFLAVVLAVLGLYGVMAYMVAQRARELGIRVALGASSGDVIWLVMREVVQMVLVGVAVSIPLALVLGRYIQSQLYGVRTSDPASIAAAAALLSGIAIVAGFVPARRAASSDPLQVLRYE
jgi:predicted permease